MDELTTKERELIEDVIVDIHFAAQKYVDNEKEVHKKLLELSIQDAIEVFTTLKEKIKKDEMKSDYFIHLLVPFQIYELIKMRDEQKD